MSGILNTNQGRRTAAGAQLEDNPKTKRISGYIEQVFRPAEIENFESFAVVEIDGYRVSGHFPHLDRHCRFNLICKSKVGYKNQEEFVIERFAEPAFVPQVLSIRLLQQLLVEIYGMDPLSAEEYCENLRRNPQLKGVDFSSINPMELPLKLDPYPEELRYISQYSIIFRFPYMELLKEFWPISDLNKLPLPILIELSIEFDASTLESFAFYWMNKFKISELKFSTVERWIRKRCQEEGKTVGQLPRLTYEEKQMEPGILESGILDRINGYNLIKKWLKNHPQLVIPHAAVLEAKVDVTMLSSFKLMRIMGLRKARPTPLDPTPEFAPFYLLTPFEKNCQRVAAAMRRLMSNHAARKPTFSRTGIDFSLFTPEQLEAYEFAMKSPFFVLTGDAGTGKTWLLTQIVKSLPRMSQEAVAYFGRVAALMRERMNELGQTIHKLLSSMKDEKNASWVRSRKRVLYIEEGSVVTLEMLGDIMDIMIPEGKTSVLEKVILSGDDKQMRPPDLGPMFEDLIASFLGTPFHRHLTIPKRAADGPGREILINNYDKMKNHRWDVSFSRDLASDHPWIFLPRYPIPQEILNEKTERSKQDRISIMMDSMRPIIQHYDNPEELQILALSNKGCKELGIAVAQLWSLKKNQGRAVGELQGLKKGDRICFTENYYCRIELPPDIEENRDKRAEILASPEWKQRSDSVWRNEMDVITEMFDFHPYTREIRAVEHLSEPKSSPESMRFLFLASGRQVNLSLYSPSKILRGDTATIASSQGSQFKDVCIYVEQPVSKFFTQRLAYTAATRAEKRVIWVLRKFNAIETSEFAQIMQNIDEAIVPVLHKFLPTFEECRVRAELPENLEQFVLESLKAKPKNTSLPVKSVAPVKTPTPLQPKQISPQQIPASELYYTKYEESDAEDSDEQQDSANQQEEDEIESENLDF